MLAESLFLSAWFPPISRFPSEPKHVWSVGMLSHLLFTKHSTTSSSFNMSVLMSQPQVYRGEPGLVHTSKPSAQRDFAPRFPFYCRISFWAWDIFSTINPADTRQPHVFSETHFPAGLSKTLSLLAVKWWNPFHVIWVGRKKKSCVVVPPPPPHCYLTPIILQVITLLGFTHSFHALCGLVVVALNCGLIIVLVHPLKHTVKAHPPTPPPLDRCHKKWLNWYVYSKAGTLLFYFIKVWEQQAWAGGLGSAAAGRTYRQLRFPNCKLDSL